MAQQCDHMESLLQLQFGMQHVRLLLSQIIQGSLAGVSQHMLKRRKQLPRNLNQKKINAPIS